MREIEVKMALAVLAEALAIIGAVLAVMWP